MKQHESHAQATPSHEETEEDVARPLRLDRLALRLDPPVVRFEEDRMTDTHER